jgi:hypothetical protein
MTSTSNYSINKTFNRNKSEVKLEGVGDDFSIDINFFSFYSCSHKFTIPTNQPVFIYTRLVKMEEDNYKDFLNH